MLYLAAGEAANVWTAVPTMLWIGVLLFVLWWFCDQLTELMEQLLIRVRSGAAMKIGAVEVGAVQRESHQLPQPIEISSLPNSSTSSVAASPEAFFFSGLRENHYSSMRRVMLVHRLFRSTVPNQIYDVLIYLVPHGTGSLLQVTRVEYFFGSYWANKIFPSVDRSRGFPVLTSAYGTFLCCARIHFNDGTNQIQFRFIDFEMGASAPVIEKEDSSGK